MVAEFSVAISP